MGFFSKIFGGKKENNVQVHAFVGDPGRDLTLDEAARLESDLERVLVSDNVSAKINAAARLMTGRKFEHALAAYRTIGEQHPDRRGTCEGQIGAALYFLGRYEEAIAHYESAIALGEDRDMMK